MANQTIQLQADMQELLLRVLSDGTLVDALEPRGIFAALLPRDVIQLSVDPFVHASEFRSGVDFIYAFCICGQFVPPDRQRPVALPTDIARAIGKALIDGLSEIPELTGHDLIPLCAALNDGFDATPQRPSPETRRSKSGRESPTADSLLSRAERAQTLLKSELADLDDAHAAYQELIFGKALSEPLQKLAHWSGFADYLAYGPHRDRCGTAKVLDLMARPAATAFEIGKALSPHQAGVAVPFDGALINSVHSCLTRARVPVIYQGTIRSWGTIEQKAQLSACSSEADADGGLSHGATGRALLHHGNQFAFSEWEGIHPVVRAGMAQADFMRIRPYWVCNDLTARVLTEIRLAEADWGGLPLALLLMKFWPVRAAGSTTTVESADVEHVRQMALICREAISVGRSLVPALIRAREQLVAQLFPNASPLLSVADAMLSNLCFRPGDLLTPDYEADQLESFLEPALKKGLVVEGPAGGCRSWVVNALRSKITPRRSSPGRR